MLDLMPSTSPNGVRIYDAQIGVPAAIEPMLINAYSTLTIPAYWRAVNFLSENLSSFPRAIIKKDGTRDDKHLLAKLLRRRPNAYQNSFVFWRTWFYHAAHYGNGYARIERTRMTGQVLSLHNVLPEDLYPFRYDRGDGYGPLQYYYWKTKKKVIRAGDMLHIAALSHDGMTGIDSIAMHTSTFQRAGTLGKFQTKFLRQGTVLRGAIEIPTGVSKDQVKEVQATLKRYFSGVDAERDVIVLSDGASLKNTTLTPQQSQIVEQGAYTTKQIAQITGVPPQFLYEFSESKYNNSIEQMGQDVVRYTFRPWIEQTEEEMSLKLLSDDEYYTQGYEIKLNPDALLRGDTKTQTDTLVATVNGRVRTPNEAREMLGLPKSDDPEADQLKTPGDTNPVDRSESETTTSETPEKTSQETKQPAQSSDSPDESKKSSDTPSTPPAKGGSTLNTEVKADGALNGAQITSVLELLSKLSTGEVSDVAAVELLVAVGILRDQADKIVKAQKGAKPPADKPATQPAARESSRHTVVEAAAITGMSKANISKLASAGKIGSNGKRGPERLVDLDSLRAYISERGGAKETDEEVERKFRDVDDEGA